MRATYFQLDVAEGRRGLNARSGIARATYVAALVAARASLSRAAWARLLRTAMNLRDALVEQDRPGRSENRRASR